MQVEAVVARPLGVIRSARISAHRDPVRTGIWGAALGLAVVAALVRHGSLLDAAGTTWPAFLTLAAVIAGGLALDGVGLLRMLARLVIPAAAPNRLAVAGALGFTALLSGLVNLDVAVVVAVPVTLAVARERGLAAGRLAVAAALTANATSFLLPTSNLTTLLVLDHAPLAAWAYLRDSWLAWLLVTALTVGVLSALADAGRRAGPAAPAARLPAASGAASRAGIGRTALALLDLLPMFVAAAAIRALLDGGLTLAGGWLGELGLAGGLAAGVDNLPAAAAVMASRGPSTWAAVLGLAIGPDLVLTGSVASLISRRIARDHGAGFGAVRFSLLGLAMLPLQLALAAIGLHLTGAVRPWPASGGLASGSERRQLSVPEERVAESLRVRRAAALGRVDASCDGAPLEAQVASGLGQILTGGNGGYRGPAGGSLEGAAERLRRRRVGPGDGEVGEEGAAVIGSGCRADERRVRVGGGVAGPAADTGQGRRGRGCRRRGGGGGCAGGRTRGGRRGDGRRGTPAPGRGEGRHPDDPRHEAGPSHHQPCHSGDHRRWGEDWLRRTAARIRVMNALSSMSSSSWRSMARRVLPSRLELKSCDGSFSDAPLKNVSFTTLVYVSPVQIGPWSDHTGTPGLEGFLHFHSSTTSGSACLIRARRRDSFSPRQSSSSPILASVS